MYDVSQIVQSILYQPKYTFGFAENRLQAAQTRYNDLTAGILLPNQQRGAQ
jgi:hypothetical protein